MDQLSLNTFMAILLEMKTMIIGLSRFIEDYRTEFNDKCCRLTMLEAENAELRNQIKKFSESETRLATENVQLQIQLMKNAEMNQENIENQQVMTIFNHLGDLDQRIDFTKHTLAEQCWSGNNPQNKAKLDKHIKRYNVCKEHLKELKIVSGHDQFPKIFNEFQNVYEANDKLRVDIFKAIFEIKKESRAMSENIKSIICDNLDMVNSFVRKRKNNLEGLMHLSATMNFQNERKLFDKTLTIAKKETFALMRLLKCNTVKDKSSAQQNYESSDQEFEEDSVKSESLSRRTQTNLKANKGENVDEESDISEEITSTDSEESQQHEVSNSFYQSCKFSDNEEDNFIQF